MEGKGVLYYSSGKIAYEGEWKADMLHGYGVLYNEHIEELFELAQVGTQVLLI